MNKSTVAGICIGLVIAGLLFIAFMLETQIKRDSDRVDQIVKFINEATQPKK